MNIYIYALIDPRDNTTRYIGQTRNPPQRLGFHLAKPKPGERRGEWIAELKTQGHKPVMRIIEEVAADRANERELWWIAETTKRGEPLTNTNGLPRPESPRRIADDKAHIPITFGLLRYLTDNMGAPVPQWLIDAPRDGLTTFRLGGHNVSNFQRRLARQIETLAASDPDDTTLLDWLTQLQDALADAFNRRH